MSDSRSCANEPCGVTFVPSRTDALYCSRICKNRAHSRRQQMQPRPSCSVTGCDRRSKALKMREPLCSTHYMRLKRDGDVGSASPIRGGRMGFAPCVVDGCTRTFYAKGMCSLHYNRLRNEGHVGQASPRYRVGIHAYVDPRTGYRYVADPRKANKRGLEHRIVMEEVLGRPLAKYENVHHINGTENLELWTKPQPAGQRPSDLVRWVVEHYREQVEAELADCSQLRLVV
jgi:hypothetical protein